MSSCSFFQMLIFWVFLVWYYKKLQFPYEPLSLMVRCPGRGIRPVKMYHLMHLSPSVLVWKMEKKTGRRLVPKSVTLNDLERHNGRWEPYPSVIINLLADERFFYTLPINWFLLYVDFRCKDFSLSHRRDYDRKFRCMPLSLSVSVVCFDLMRYTLFCK